MTFRRVRQGKLDVRNFFIIKPFLFRKKRGKIWEKDMFWSKIGRESSIVGEES